MINVDYKSQEFFNGENSLLSGKGKTVCYGLAIIAFGLTGVGVVGVLSGAGTSFLVTKVICVIVGSTASGALFTLLVVNNTLLVVNKMYGSKTGFVEKEEPTKKGFVYKEHMHLYKDTLLLISKKFDERNDFSGYFHKDIRQDVLSKTFDNSNKIIMIFYSSNHRCHHEADAVKSDEPQETKDFFAHSVYLHITKENETSLQDSKNSNDKLLLKYKDRREKYLNLLINNMSKLKTIN